MISGDHVWLLAAALVLDAIVGDPASLWRRVPHPVAWIGGGIAFLDQRLNRPDDVSPRRRAMGVTALVVIVVATAAIGFAIELLFRVLPFGWVGTMLLASIFLAGRSLYDHVADVARSLAVGLPQARQMVSRIVGRDPEALDEHAICRAAIESTAENFSDAVVAPALWFLLLGLPGLLAYKAINTADSMIGHRTDRYRDFGWATARLDDLVNLPASRIAGLLVALAGPLASGSISQSLRVMVSEASRHRSPNAGWPEAAMAAALGVALAGPRHYDGILVDDATMNARGRRNATTDDIWRGLRVYVGANILLLALLVLLGTVFFL